MYSGESNQLVVGVGERSDGETCKHAQKYR